VTVDVGERFEAFPRAPLPLRWQRRQLLRLFTDEVRILLEPGRQGAACRLADLGTLPDEVLGRLTPCLAEGCPLRAQGGALWASPEGAQPLRLFGAESQARRVVERFDGRTPLREIAEGVRAVSGWEPERAFAYVRGVFLHLVTLGVCVPK
jgi:hypothetical protein